MRAARRPTGVRGQRERTEAAWLRRVAAQTGATRARRMAADVACVSALPFQLYSLTSSSVTATTVTPGQRRLSIGRASPSRSWKGDVAYRASLPSPVRLFVFAGCTSSGGFARGRRPCERSATSRRAVPVQRRSATSGPIQPLPGRSPWVERAARARRPPRPKKRRSPGWRSATAIRRAFGTSPAICAAVRPRSVDASSLPPG